MTYMAPRPEGLNTEPAPKSVVETLKPRTWHKGPPPHVGWWNASLYQSLDVWRWWDGEQWSSEAYDDEDEQMAEFWARLPSGSQDLIEWTDYWPENARVPRVDPNEVKA
ncbi:hypothetical protein [Pandoraea pnomenusa]|uniref:hypothetical protein n=1 Tax=Pandoraea pnomenusa TaxID=93220 RepID=UPI0033405A1C